MYKTTLPQPSLSYTKNNATTDTIKLSSGTLFCLIATNANTSMRWLQIHNTANALAGNEVPIIAVPIPAGNGVTPGVWELNTTSFGGGGFALSNGITWSVSSNANSYVAAANTDHVISAFYS